MQNQIEMKYFYFALITLLLTCFITVFAKKEEKVSCYRDQIQAAKDMKMWTEEIAQEKEAAGIALSNLDYFQTGLIGDKFNEYTTTEGNPESKRTAADPSMAALMVRMYSELGLKEGDSVALAFSGSFPGLNLACLAACEAMNLKPIIITSFGASSYGANQKGFSFPEMLHRLYLQGMVPWDSDMVTLGGADDVLKDKDPLLRTEVCRRLQDLGLSVYEEEDYTRNVRTKGEWLLKQGDIQCFIAVGGNMTFFGRGAGDLSKRQGIIYPGSIRNPMRAEDGLLGFFINKNIPVIHMLNIKKICADYGLPFDPASQPVLGQGPLYHQYTYPKLLPSLVLSGLLIGAIVLHAREKNKKELFV